MPSPASLSPICVEQQFVPEALVSSHARLLPDPARAELDPNLVSVQLVAVELFEDLVDLVPSGVGVNVDEAKVLDHVGFNHRHVPLKNGAQVVVGGPLFNVTWKNLNLMLKISVR